MTRSPVTAARRCLVSFALLLVGACEGPAPTPEAAEPAAESAEPAFTPDDEAAVRDLEEAYRTAWLANDSAAVMATLTDDAVLLPGGMEPLSGETDIRAFWWPDDGSTTTITAYDIVVREVEGSGELAYLRGEGALEFTYTGADGESSDLTSRATHLSVARRGEDGTWRIARRAWSAIR
ncbi:MAG TPA: SgcJ/EcaC family oxidoreductase [Longimicrobiales bacterium]|nr:SgcJ/EcaC family oxidoreductase [Longimicrobiales bacterium]